MSEYHREHHESRRRRTGGRRAVMAALLSVVGAFAGSGATATAYSDGPITAPTDVTLTFSVDNKIYDGTPTATLSGITPSAPFVGDVNVTYTAAFDTKHVGNGKNVAITFTLTGMDAGNYNVVNTPTTGTANITQRDLTPVIVANDKTYDGNRNAAVNFGSHIGFVGGDVISLDSGTRLFDTKNVGTGKTVTVSNIHLTGAGTDDGNYNLTSSTATDLADITARSLHVTATASNKEYDATIGATASLSTDALGGSDVTVAYTTATFGTKAVGTGKTVTVSGISIFGGLDAGNYSLANVSTTTTADITQRPLTVTAVASDKIYDGNTSATAALSTDAIFGDDVTALGTATFATKTVGVGKTVAVNSIAISGPDAGNYSLSNTTATDTADITHRTITVSATASDKPYDGNTTAVAALTSDKVPADVVTLSYVSATFDNKFVGTGKLVTVSGIAIGGFDSPNYTLGNTTATATAAITPVLLLDAAEQVYDAAAGAGTSLYAAATSYLFPVDINGDGRMDVVNATTRGVQVFRNDGNVMGHLSLVLVQEIAATYSHGGGAVDID
ncbi:MAG: hypothetical protein K8T90_20315, partial [Planctomycetes bacterium]|nr:hypothetical protein [Planctomycetota bacterium]